MPDVLDRWYTEAGPDVQNGHNCTLWLLIFIKVYPWNMEFSNFLCEKHCIMNFDVYFKRNNDNGIRIVNIVFLLPSPVSCFDDWQI